MPGDSHLVTVTYTDLPAEVQPGDTILLSDGALELEVVDTTSENVICQVTVGGPLSSHKGVNLPTRSIKTPSLTDKDREDLVFGIRKGVDYVALSFVRTASDVVEARRFVEQLGATVPLIAKIEKHEALRNIDEIIETADGIMVARGDLGVETPLARIHRRRASGQCPEAARGCSCESGIMVLKQQSRPQNKEHPIDATTQPSRSHPNRV